MIHGTSETALQEICQTGFFLFIFKLWIIYFWFFFFLL